MYRTCLIAGLVFTIGIIFIHFVVTRGKVSVAAQPVKPRNGLLRLLVCLIYLVAFFCFVALSVTGFYPVLFTGKPLSGYPLMLHATAAPVFAVCVVLVALLWAHRNRFGETDWNSLLMRCGKSQCDKNACSCTVLWRKIFFWLMVLLTIPVILSIALSMLPLFGTKGQIYLFHMHRCCTVLLVISGTLFGYLALVSRTRPQK